MSVAEAEARRSGASCVESSHLFIAACKLEPPALVRAMTSLGIDPVRARRRARALCINAAPVNTPADVPLVTSVVARAAIERAQTRCERAGRRVNVEAITTALLGVSDRVVELVLREAGVSAAVLADRIDALSNRAPAGRANEGPTASAVQQGGAPVAADVARQRAPAPMANQPGPLERYGRDLSALARANKLEPVVGRDDEIKLVVRIMLRKSKSNAVLVGDAGVGKSAIVEGLAQKCARDDAPEEVRNLRIIEVSLAALLSGTKFRGDFEERVDSLIRAATDDPTVVLFIDELHTVVGAGATSGGVDAANLLKPALARGEFRCIGATTPEEYRERIEKDPALSRRFQPVRVDEPTPAQARTMLIGTKKVLEQHHDLVIEDDAIDAAIELSVRYLPDRRLPDKARDLLDQASSARRFVTFSPRGDDVTNATSLRREDIARVVEEWTGVPVGDRATALRAMLANAESHLRKRVMGQDRAVSVVANAVRVASAGMARPGRPAAVLLFVGPTGVGKTELAKALAELLFHDERSLVRFDMSEYHDRHTVQRLLGAPPGYVGHEDGGQLVNAIRRNPYCVVLFDEFEKADPQVTDVLLQLCDEGRVTDAHGRVGDFSNAYIVLTSNALAPPQGAARKVGFGAEAIVKQPARTDQQLRVALQGAFRPELIGRIGAIVEFDPLDDDALRSVLVKLLAPVKNSLQSKGHRLAYSEAALDALLSVERRPELGARELDRVVDRVVVQPVARALIEGRIAPNSTVALAVDANGFSLRW